MLRPPLHSDHSPDVESNIRSDAANFTASFYSALGAIDARMFKSLNDIFLSTLDNTLHQFEALNRLGCYSPRSRPMGRTFSLIKINAIGMRRILHAGAHHIPLSSVAKRHGLLATLTKHIAHTVIRETGFPSAGLIHSNLASALFICDATAIERCNDSIADVNARLADSIPGLKYVVSSAVPAISLGADESFRELYVRCQTSSYREERLIALNEAALIRSEANIDPALADFVSPGASLDQQASTKRCEWACRSMRDLAKEADRDTFLLRFDLDNMRSTRWCNRDDSLASQLINDALLEVVFDKVMPLLLQNHSCDRSFDSEPMLLLFSRCDDIKIVIRENIADVEDLLVRIFATGLGLRLKSGAAKLYVDDTSASWSARAQTSLKEKRHGGI